MCLLPAERSGLVFKDFGHSPFNGFISHLIHARLHEKRVRVIIIYLLEVGPVFPGVRFIQYEAGRDLDLVNNVNATNVIHLFHFQKLEDIPERRRRKGERKKERKKKTQKN